MVAPPPRPLVFSQSLSSPALHLLTSQPPQRSPGPASATGASFAASAGQSSALPSPATTRSSPSSSTGLSAPLQPVDGAISPRKKSPLAPLAPLVAGDQQESRQQQYNGQTSTSLTAAADDKSSNKAAGEAAPYPSTEDESASSSAAGQQQQKPGDWGQPEVRQQVHGSVPSSEHRGTLESIAGRRGDTPALSVAGSFSQASTTSSSDYDSFGGEHQLQQHQPSFLFGLDPGTGAVAERDGVAFAVTPGQWVSAPPTMPIPPAQSSPTSETFFESYQASRSSRNGSTVKRAPPSASPFTAAPLPDRGRSASFSSYDQASVPIQPPQPVYYQSNQPPQYSHTLQPLPHPHHTLEPYSGYYAGPDYAQPTQFQPLHHDSEAYPLHSGAAPQYFPAPLEMTPSALGGADHSIPSHFPGTATGDDVRPASAPAAGRTAFFEAGEAAYPDASAISPPRSPGGSSSSSSSSASSTRISNDPLPSEPSPAVSYELLSATYSTRVLPSEYAAQVRLARAQERPAANRSKRKLTEQDKRDIVLAHRANPKLTQQESATKYECDRSTISKIQKDADKWLNPKPRATLPPRGPILIPRPFPTGPVRPPAVSMTARPPQSKPKKTQQEQQQSGHQEQQRSGQFSRNGPETRPIGRFPVTEQKVNEWLENEYRAGRDVSDLDIRDTAVILHEQYREEEDKDLRASAKWLASFKERRRQTGTWLTKPATDVAPVVSSEDTADPTLYDYGNAHAASSPYDLPPINTQQQLPLALGRSNSLAVTSLDYRTQSSVSSSAPSPQGYFAQLQAAPPLVCPSFSSTGSSYAVSPGYLTPSSADGRLSPGFHHPSLDLTPTKRKRNDPVGGMMRARSHSSSAIVTAGSAAAPSSSTTLSGPSRPSSSHKMRPSPMHRGNSFNTVSELNATSSGAPSPRHGKLSRSYMANSANTSSLSLPHRKSLAGGPGFESTPVIYTNFTYGRTSYASPKTSPTELDSVSPRPSSAGVTYSLSIPSQEDGSSCSPMDDYGETEELIAYDDDDDGYVGMSGVSSDGVFRPQLVSRGNDTSSAVENHLDGLHISQHHPHSMQNPHPHLPQQHSAPYYYEAPDEVVGLPASGMQDSSLVHMYYPDQDPDQHSQSEAPLAYYVHPDDNQPPSNYTMMAEAPTSAYSRAPHPGWLSAGPTDPPAYYQHHPSNSLQQAAPSLTISDAGSTTKTDSEQRNSE